jgi:hypothetical protein
LARGAEGSESLACGRRGGSLDTIIFILIFFTLLAMGTGRRWLVLTLFFASLAATMLLFNHHATSTLDLNF